MGEALAEGHGNDVGNESSGEHGGDPEDRAGVEVGSPRPDAARSAERRAAVAVVDELQDVRADGDGEHGDDGDRPDERCPREQRRPVKAHPRSPRGEHRGGERGRYGGQSTEDEDVGTEVQLDHRRVAAERPAVEREGDHEQHDPRQPAPPTGGGEAGEGERSGAELQGHDEHADAEEQRYDRRLDETHPEGGEQLAVVVGIEQRGVPVDPFDAENDSDDGDGEQTEQRAADEYLADRLVVAGRQHACGGNRLAEPDGRRLSDDGRFEGGIESAHRWCGGLTVTSRRTLLVDSGRGGNLTSAARRRASSPRTAA